VDTITLSQSVRLFDIAFNPVDMLFYGQDQISNTIVSVDPITGQVTPIGGIVSQDFGAAYSFADGNIYFNDNDGSGFYQLNTVNGQLVKISDSPGAGNNDGAGCNDAILPLPTDLEITKTDNDTIYCQGTDITYTITVKNNGIFGVLGAIVEDQLPAGITTATWSCVDSSGTSCSGSGTGSLMDTINLEVGDSIVYEFTLSIPDDFTGDLINVATVTNPSNSPDTIMMNNMAGDTNTLVLPPVAMDDCDTTIVGTPLVITPVTNDIQGTYLIDTLGIDTVNSIGTLVIPGDGTFIFTPDPGAMGTFEFEYVVCDTTSKQTCDTGMIKVLVLNAELGVAKSVTNIEESASMPGVFDVTYSVVVQNTGEVVLDSLTLEDDIAMQLGSAFLGVTTPPSLISSDANMDPTVPGTFPTSLIVPETGELSPGQSYTIEFTISVDASELANPGLNTVVAGGDDPNGTEVIDSSDSGTDPTTDNPDDPGD
ncbi:MAG: Ig-like domain-containing protein, partial [Bacteroidota bacterium]